MSFSLNKIKQQNFRPQELRTTLIQVTGYEVEGDPRNHRILGLDLEDLDDQGVPKQVRVAIEPYSGNASVLKPKDFAEWVNAKTEIGGTIMIQRAYERNGELVADYAQRISATKDWVRNGNNGVDYKIGCQRGFIRVAPRVDRSTGQLELRGGGSGPAYHTADVSFFPDQESTVIEGGPGFDDRLLAALHHAIDSVADPRMQPQLIFSQESEGSHVHLLVKNQERAENSKVYRKFSKEEMKQELVNNKEVNKYMGLCSAPEAQGVRFQVRSGFGLNLMGRRDINNDSTNFLRQSGRIGPNEVIYNPTRVEKLAPETLQNFRLPPHMQTDTRKRDIKNRPVFVHGYVSYEIPINAPSHNVTLQKIAKTLDKNFDQRNSVNGGITVLENPHWEKDDQGMFIYPDQDSQQNQASQQQTNFQASMAAQAPMGQPAQQQAAPQQSAVQQQVTQQQPVHQQHYAPQQQGGYQQPAAAQGYNQPDPIPEPPIPSDSEIDQFMDPHVDFDMDDLESQLDQAPGL